MPGARAGTLLGTRPCDRRSGGAPGACSGAQAPTRSTSSRACSRHSGQLAGCLRAISDTPRADAARQLQRRSRGRPVCVGWLMKAFARSADGFSRAGADGKRALDALTRAGARWTNVKVLLAAPRSFCAGVDRAIEIVERLLEAHGAADLRPPRDRPQRQRRAPARRARRGLRRLRGRHSAGEICVLSAHGVAPSVRENCAARGLRVVDAVCPLVSKVHAEARRYADSGHLVALIGHADHVEVIGTKGERPGADRRRRVAGGCRRARDRRQARGRHLPDDALARRRGGDRHRARGSLRRRSRVRAPTTSVTRRRTARTR